MGEQGRAADLDRLGRDGSTLTDSGYPFVVKRLKRGQAMEAAGEVFRGAKDNVGVWPMSLEDEAGNRWFGVSQAETFFTSSYFVFPQSGEGAPIKLPIPKKASPQGLFAGSLVLTLEEDWAPEGQGAFKAGDLVAFNWASFMADGRLPKVELVFRPTPKQALQGVGISKNQLLVNISDNVAVKVMAYTRDGANWVSKEVPLPPNGSAGVIYADHDETTAFLGYEGYLSPDTLYTYDTTSGDVKQLRQLPAWFDAGPYKVDQHEATSKDGTKVPYFVVHKKDIKLDGTNPTLVYGYGGFQVSQTPGYSGTVGKLWLEQGGVYVMANIRGGGEFGPAWHQAGLKTKRQVVYDDFIAVAEDLVDEEDHLAKAHGRDGRIEWRPADGRDVHAAAGPVQRHRLPGAAARHAALSPAAGGRLVDRRVRRSGRAGRARVAREAVALSQCRCQQDVSRDLLRDVDQG